MRKETRTLIVERYTGWVETWGLSLAFAVTQSVERSEAIVAEAIVALVAATAEDELTRNSHARASRTAAFTRDRGAEFSETPSPIKPVRPGELILAVSAQRFAAVLWELSDAQAYRGFGADPFFRMPAIARAIVILKTRAQFSRQQIAGVIRLPLEQVDGHLENARLLFSDGRPWIEASPGLLVDGASWQPDCPRWRAEVPHASPDEGPPISEVFAQYVGNDLDTDAGTQLHSHLLICNSCRSSFSYFKRTHADWVASLPLIEPPAPLRKHLTRITRMALSARRSTVAEPRRPRAMPGVRRLLKDGTFWAMIAGAAIAMAGQSFLHRHSAIAHALRPATKQGRGAN